MPLPTTPAERLARLHVALPEGTQLAQALSVSVRAEPELVRQIRLILFPGSGAGMEADLYFSPFVAQRTPDWILLDPQLSLELQERLAMLVRDDERVQSRMTRVRQVVQQAHASAPIEIAWEEEVIWLAVMRRGGVHLTRAAIDHTLRAALTRILRGSEESSTIARWFASAARRLPRLARETQAFNLLAFAASITLGGRKIEAGPHASLEMFEEGLRYLPESMKRIDMWMALTSSGLHVTFSPMPRYERITVPHTNPILLEVRTGNEARQLTHVTPGQSNFVPTASGAVIVRTLSREVLHFRPRIAGRTRASASPSTSTALKNDVYISSSAIDAEWVRSFAKHLERRLREITGRRDVRVWMNVEISPGEPKEASLAEILSSVVFLTVVSPGYLQSKHSGLELETFLKHVHESEGVAFGNISRIVTVFRMPVRREEVPPQLREHVEFRFYKKDTLTDQFVEFEPGSERFSERIDDLAHSIAQMLKARERDLPAIFLTATQDLEVMRQRLVKELTIQGYRVSAEAEDISTSKASIFLIGQVDARSLQELSDQIAKHLASSPYIQTYVWTPRDLDLSGFESRGLLDSLALHPRVEMIRTGFEDLLDYLSGVLRMPAQRSAAGDSSSPLVYLMCANEDREDIEPLARLAADHGIVMRAPLFSGELRAMREAQRQMLRECDGVVVYWGRGAGQWFEANLDDAIRARRSGKREKPLMLAVYVGPPRTPEKHAFRDASPANDVTIIHAEESPTSGMADLTKVFVGASAKP